MNAVLGMIDFAFGLRDFVETAPLPLPAVQFPQIAIQVVPGKVCLANFGFMQKKAVSFLRRLFLLDDTPERIALAFALGVFLAFSPLLGLHTLLGLVLSLMFGLNRVALLLGVFVNNPWTLVPIYAAGTYLGGLIVGFPRIASFPSFQWNMLFNSGFWVHILSQWHFLKPLVLGSSILSVIAAGFSYMLVLRIIRNYRAGHKQS
jgi:uncharacterized protein